ncbi:hypothetical protein SAMN04487915_108162 [Arthrobacter sp. ov118]|nr:hypothetical protein SAMN04487915_108162 [Arthrobacter sp. ov118]
MPQKHRSKELSKEWTCPHLPRGHVHSLFPGDDRRPERLPGRRDMPILRGKGCAAGPAWGTCPFFVVQDVLPGQRGEHAHSWWRGMRCRAPRGEHARSSVRDLDIWAICPSLGVRGGHVPGPKAYLEADGSSAGTCPFFRPRPGPATRLDGTCPFFRPTPGHMGDMSGPWHWGRACPESSGSGPGKEAGSRTMLVVGAPGRTGGRASGGTRPRAGLGSGRRGVGLLDDAAPVWAVHLGGVAAVTVAVD